MKVLLDTHLLLWAMIAPERLSVEVLSLIEDSDNLLLFSVASIWEAAIKHSRGRSDFQFEPIEFRRQLLASALEELPIFGKHALAVASLPPIHKDPFDRILMAQAMVEGIEFWTADSVLAKYPGRIRLV